MNLPLSSLLSAAAAPQPGAAVVNKAPDATVPNTGFAALLAQLGASAPLAANVPQLPANADLATLMQHLTEAGLGVPRDAAPPVAAVTQETAAQKPALDSLLDALRTFAPAQAEAVTAALGAMTTEYDASEPEAKGDDSEPGELPPALLALLQQLGIVQAQVPAPTGGTAATQETATAAIASVATSLPSSLPPAQPANAPAARPLPTAPGMLNAELAAVTATAPAVAITAAALAQPPAAAKESPVQNGTPLPQTATELLELMTPAGAAPDEATAFSLPVAPGAAPLANAASPAFTAPAAATSTLLLAQPLDTPPWRVEFGQQLAQLALKQGDQRVSLQLHPTELGPLTVELRVRDGQADIQFLSAHQQVRSAVNDALPQLREALSQQGIALGHANVGSQERQEQWRGEQPGDLAQDAPMQAGAAQELETITPAAPTLVAASGRVNLYV